MPLRVYFRPLASHNQRDARGKQKPSSLLFPLVIQDESARYEPLFQKPNGWRREKLRDELPARFVRCCFPGFLREERGSLETGRAGFFSSRVRGNVKGPRKIKAKLLHLLFLTSRSHSVAIASEPQGRFVAVVVSSPHETQLLSGFSFGASG